MKARFTSSTDGLVTVTNASERCTTPVFVGWLALAQSALKKANDARMSPVVGRWIRLTERTAALYEHPATAPDSTQHLACDAYSANRSGPKTS